jgi:hypothetical protein
MELHGGTLTLSQGENARETISLGFPASRLIR